MRLWQKNLKVYHGNPDQIMQKFGIPVTQTSEPENAETRKEFINKDICRVKIIAESQTTAIQHPEDLRRPLQDNAAQDYAQGLFEARLICCIASCAKHQIIISDDNEKKDEIQQLQIFIANQGVGFNYKNQTGQYCGFSLIIPKKGYTPTATLAATATHIFAPRDSRYAACIIEDCNKEMNKCPCTVYDYNQMLTEDQTVIKTATAAGHQQILDQLNNATIKKIITPIFNSDSSINLEYYDQLVTTIEKLCGQREIELDINGTKEAASITNQDALLAAMQPHRPTENDALLVKNKNDMPNYILNLFKPAVPTVALTAAGSIVGATKLGSIVAATKTGAVIGAMLGHGICSLPAAAVGAITGCILGALATMAFYIIKTVIAQVKHCGATTTTDKYQSLA